MGGVEKSKTLPCFKMWDRKSQFTPMFLSYTKISVVLEIEMLQCCR